jgi:predicted GIY-YIG superfamily endonuclease
MTVNLERRISEHQSGDGGWFTSLARPVELIYYEQLPTEEKARQRETQLKKWSRKKKFALAARDLEALKKA